MMEFRIWVFTIRTRQHVLGEKGVQVCHGSNQTQKVKHRNRVEWYWSWFENRKNEEIVQGYKFLVIR